MCSLAGPRNSPDIHGRVWGHILSPAELLNLNQHTCPDGSHVLYCQLRTTVCMHCHSSATPTAVSVTVDKCTDVHRVNQKSAWKSVSLSRCAELDSRGSSSCDEFEIKYGTSYVELAEWDLMADVCHACAKPFTQKNGMNTIRYYEHGIQREPSSHAIVKY